MPDSSLFIDCSRPVSELSNGFMYPVTGAHICGSAYWRCQAYTSSLGTESAMTVSPAMIEPRCTSNES